MKVKTNKILILMGLPASGKSFWADNNYLESDDSLHLDLDKMLNNTKDLDIGEIVKKYYGAYDIIILDGLFLTTDDITKIISKISSKINLDSLSFEIHYWNPNRDQCLVNDSLRRNVDSSITIKNAIIEYPNIEKIKQLFDNLKIQVKEHEVYNKPDWEVFAEENDISLNEESFYSESWCLGGSWRNCWGDSGQVNSEPQPEFVELDSILTKLCPNISFLQYKNIYNKCASIDEYGDSDYYGGSTSHARFVCHFPTLYRTLLENNLITR
jgi:hypothetical protein